LGTQAANLPAQQRLVCSDERHTAKNCGGDDHPIGWIRMRIRQLGSGDPDFTVQRLFVDSMAKHESSKRASCHIELESPSLDQHGDLPKGD
jgi:hypothetical protein